MTCDETNCNTGLFMKTIVLDLDGTLADTNRDLIPVLNRTTATVGLPPVSMEDTGHVVGYGVLAMIRKAFALHDEPLTQEMTDHLFAIYLDDYEDNLAVNTILFDGVVTALDHLLSEGWRLAVCTNKLERLARKLLEELGVADRFSAIAGGDTFAARKPDPIHLTETIAMAGGDRSAAIMVGDSGTDITTAQAADIPVIAVDFGYSDRPVAHYRPDRVISSYHDLVPAVHEIARALPGLKQKA